MRRRNPGLAHAPEVFQIQIECFLCHAEAKVVAIEERGATLVHATRELLDVFKVFLFADPKVRVLVGAIAVGPQAAEWLGQLTLAVRSATPLDVLLDTIQPYPSFSEAIFFALRELEGALAAA